MNQFRFFPHLAAACSGCGCACYKKRKQVGHCVRRVRAEGKYVNAQLPEISYSFKQASLNLLRCRYTRLNRGSQSVCCAVEPVL